MLESRHRYAGMASRQCLAWLLASDAGRMDCAGTMRWDRISYFDRRTNMSDLVVIGFENPHKADEVLARLRKLKKEYLIDLEDAVIVIRDEKGEVHLKQTINLTALGASSGLLSGSLWGAVVGLIFLNPIAGFLLGGVIGAGTGAMSGSLSDYGINDEFIKSLAETIPVNSSALFILARKVQPEKVLAEFSDVKGKVLRTSLSPDQEKRLQEALAGSKTAAKT